MICLWLVLPHAASSTSGRKMDLLLLFLTSHWQRVAAPSLELAIIFHLRKGIEKENTFWCVCILSIIQRYWHFTAAFFLLLPSDNDVTPRQNTEAGWGGVWGCCQVLCFPTDTCSSAWLDYFVWFLPLLARDLQDLLCIPELSTALSTLGWASLSVAQPQAQSAL